MSRLSSGNNEPSGDRKKNLKDGKKGFYDENGIQD